MIRIGFPLLVIAGMVSTIITNLDKLRVLLVELYQSSEMGRYYVIGFAIWVALSLIVTVFVTRQSNKKRMPLAVWLSSFLFPLLSLYLISLCSQWLGHLVKLDQHVLFVLFLGIIIFIMVLVIVRRNYMSSKFYFYRQRQSISTVLLLPYLWLYVSYIFVQLGELSVGVSPHQIFIFALAALVALGTFAFGTDLRQI